MGHPIMFGDADPVLDRLRAICLALPGADEKVSHGRPNFFTTTVFAVYGGGVRGDHDPEPHRRAVLVLADPHTRAALLERERCFLPGYYGPSGWVGLDLARPGEPLPDIDWVEVAELVDASYRMTAPARLVRELDARG